MATCNYIPAKKQTRGAMQAVIRYVSQDMKTLDDRGWRYLTGINCLTPAAYDEFIATKNLYGKRNGVMYYHYTQSFAPGEIKDYDTAHEIGQQLAVEMFPGFEVLVATHLDAYDDDCRQRVHNHFVINSVSIDTGLKMDYGPRTLEKMRKVSDRLCKEHGLSVLPRYEQQFITKGLGPREYRAALRSDAWKFRAIYDIEEAMKRVATKAEFLSLMESHGYSVIWSDSRKYITYTCPNGMKVRDNKLHETKFLKESMEYEFTIRQQIIECGSAEAEANDCGINADDNRNSVSSDRLRNPEGRLESDVSILKGVSGIPADTLCEIQGACSGDADQRGLEHTDTLSQRMGECSRGGSGGSGEENRGQDAENSYGEPRTPVTGWENERIIFLRSTARSEWADWGDREFACENEKMGTDYTPRKRGTDIRVEYGDLSSDELNGFFDGENNSDDEEIDEEYLDEQIEYLLDAEQDGSAYAAYLLGRIFMCGEVVPKDIPEAIRHFEIASSRGNSYADYRLGQIYLFEPDFFDMDAALNRLNRSAQAGNESAAMALHRMAENSFLAITTNVLELVGGLCDIEPRRQVKDCTTMPQKRERRKWEQRM